MSIGKVIDCIKKSRTFLITTHQCPEGDALGSEIALYNLLKKIGKTAVIVNQSPTPREYTFLKGSELIRPFRYNKKFSFDILVMLDCSDKYRCGCVARLVDTCQRVVNIDHHISNDYFGDINWVLPTASSVSEMIYKLYKMLRIQLDIDTARALYVGILTDTGSFRYVNTNSFTHKMAAELLKFHLDVYNIYRNIYEDISFSDILLLSKVILTIKREASGKIITFQIRHDLLKGKRIHFDLTEHVLNFGRLVHGAEVCILFKEQQSKAGRLVRVNLRSRGKVDVNHIAQFFGGGGHKTASGYTVSGSIEEVKKRTIKKIKERLRYLL